MPTSERDRRVDDRSRNQLASHPDRLVARVAAEQDGVVSLAQLRARGVSSRAVTTRVRSGRLHRLYRGVYAVGHVAVPARGRLRAAALACGETAVLSHFSAAEFWGLVAPRDRLPQVSVSDAGGRGVAGIRVHRRRSLEARDVWSRAGIRVTCPARTLLDIAPSLSAEALRRTARQAQAEGRVNVHQLVEVLSRATGQRGAAALRVVVADGPAPTRSELEDAVLLLIERVSPVRPEINVMLRLAGERAIRPDFMWRATRVVIEADGAAWHEHKLTREEDAAKQAILEAHGFRVLRITWEQAVRRPQQTMARIAAAVACADRYRSSLS
jgi:predicted transcriptional regulator of viral defense system